MQPNFGEGRKIYNILLVRLSHKNNTKVVHKGRQRANLNPFPVTYNAKEARQSIKNRED